VVARMDRAIGMFDSGFGGLTVARAVIDLLPAEHLVYIGDTGRYPYGSKPQAEVRGYAHEIAWSLVKDFDVKAIVVACNTASAAALDDLRADLPVPVIDVVEPGAAALVTATRSGRVGVIGTVGTIGSGAYDRAVAATGAGVELTSAACPGLVEFVERGQTTGDEIHILTERLLAPVKDAGVDALLLGCTHYPYLARVISDVMGPDVILVSSADETAFAARDQLARDGLLRAAGSEPTAEHRFMSSGDITWFADLGGRLLGPELRDADRWQPLHTPAASGGSMTDIASQETP
jgi:glutamate racemase